jgi:acyl dehydratase
MPGLYYEQLEVGRRFVHDIRRTVTETDNVLFTTLTHNPAAIHLDAEASRKGPYGQVLVNSVFTLGLMVGVSVRFPKPVFVGDTLRAETEVVERRESRSRPECGIVVFKHVAFNQRDEMVASCLRSALMYKKEVLF